MKINDFLQEWHALCADPMVARFEVEYRIALFEQWVAIRKDVAAVQARNKLWADLISTAVGFMKDELSKFPAQTPTETAAKDAIGELVARLEEAMAQHKKMDS